MTHPYKTREGGATVTIFVPYDCRNHCPFCVNKQEYAHAEGFSVEAILKSIAVMDEITPRCDFVFTGGEPFANLKALQRMLDAIPTTHKVYINTTFPVQPGCSAEEMIAFTERNQRQDHLHQHLAPPARSMSRSRPTRSSPVSQRPSV